MLPSRRCFISILVVGTVSTFFLPSAAAQITVFREYRGKMIACSVSGLRGFSAERWLDPSYEFVFIASILSLFEDSPTEMHLQVRPEEVFLGTPSGDLEVTTSQAGCLPELRVGDRWLIFLQRDKQSHALVLWYGSPSGPEKEQREEIALLRRLVRMGSGGVVKGYVQRVDWKHGEEDHVDLPNHRIIATRKSDRVRSSAFTDKNGHYEFESLPVGTYGLSANTADGLWAEEGPVEVRPHGCTSVGFELEPDGRIAGNVTTSDRKPAKPVEVYAVPVSDAGYEFVSGWTDEHGHFEIKGVRPGRYLVGVNIEPDSSASEHSFKVYYPGVPTREKAIEVKLARAEKRIDIDFQVPQSPAH